MTIPNLAAGQASIAFGPQGPELLDLVGLRDRRPRHRRGLGDDPPRRRRRDDRGLVGGGRRRGDGRGLRRDARALDPQRRPGGRVAPVRSRARRLRHRRRLRLRHPRDAGACRSARGAPPLAEVVGYGATADSSHITLPAPGGAGAIRAVRRALAKAGLTPDDVEHFNAHATSTPEGDKTEIEMIKTLFGARAGDVSVTANKSMIGHTLGAAGAIEAIITILSLRDGLIPPTINLDDPEPAARRPRPDAQRRARAGDPGGRQQFVRLRRPERRACARAVGRMSEEMAVERVAAPGAPETEPAAPETEPPAPEATAPNLLRPKRPGRWRRRPTPTPRWWRSSGDCPPCSPNPTCPSSRSRPAGPPWSSASRPTPHPSWWRPRSRHPRRRPRRRHRHPPTPPSRRPPAVPPALRPRRFDARAHPGRARGRFGCVCRPRRAPGRRSAAHRRLVRLRDPGRGPVRHRRQQRQRRPGHRPDRGDEAVQRDQVRPSRARWPGSSPRTGRWSAPSSRSSRWSPCEHAAPRPRRPSCPDHRLGLLRARGRHHQRRPRADGRHLRRVDRLPDRDPASATSRPPTRRPPPWPPSPAGARSPSPGSTPTRST